MAFFNPIADFKASTAYCWLLKNALFVINVYFGQVKTSTRSHLSSHQLAYHGSNSWMMLSNRITAKSLELNPARQARKRMLNDSKDCHPAGCVSPPDRPPFPPPPPAEPGRLFPCTEPRELLNALCLPSLAAWCSAISACGFGWICSCVPSATLGYLPALRTVENSSSLRPLSKPITSYEFYGCMSVLVRHHCSSK